MASTPKAQLSKEEKALRKAARKAAAKQKRKQFVQAFNLQRKEDKLLLPLLIGSFVGIFGLSIVLGFVFDKLIFLPLTGFLLSIIVCLVIFSRRVQSSVYAKADGQAGAAAWVLENMKGKWRVTKVVSSNAQFDAVHRVIGLPGVVFVGEGSPSRVKQLLAQEKKRAARLVGSTPIYDVIVGTEEGTVALKDLQRHIVKLPRNIDAKRIDELEAKMVALSSRGAALPKGPMPGGAKMSGMQRRVRRR